MRKSYLVTDENYSRYIHRESYITTENYRNQYVNYATLPEEYDVFSELVPDLKEKWDESGHKEQLILLDTFLNDLREKLKYLFMWQGVVRVLPKLKITKDPDDALIVNWAYSNYRIFINIEKNVEDSFYGIVAQDEEKNMFSNSGKFDEKNCEGITNKILDYIFNQT